MLLDGFPQQPSTGTTSPPTQRGGASHAGAEHAGLHRDHRPRPRRAYATTETAADIVACSTRPGSSGRHRRARLGRDGRLGVAGWYPERVATLTSLSTPHPAAFRDGLRAGQARASWYMAVFQLPAAEALARRTLMKSLVGSGLPAESAEAYAAAMAEPGAWTGAFNWYRGLPFSTKPVGRIRVPTTYVWGRNDAALVRSTAEATAKYVVGPYTFVDLDAGHWLPETERRKRRQRDPRARNGDLASPDLRESRDGHRPEPGTERQGLLAGVEDDPDHRSSRGGSRDA